MDGSNERIGQEQIHQLLFNDKLSWQAIIYDLINTEQLDPWDINLMLLTEKFLERVRALEEANFFISSKVLLAASLLLRIKSEIVLNEDIPSLDAILEGKSEEEEQAYTQQRIELEGELPTLVPRTPLPRFRRVSLEELMGALSHAIATENRRIKKHIMFRQQEREVAISIPKRTVNLKEHIEIVYQKLIDSFSNRTSRLAFSELLHKGSREDRISAFIALLHLDTQQRVWLEQEGHFEEIWVWLKHLYELAHKDRLEALRVEVDAFMKKAEEEQELSDSEMGKHAASLPADPASHEEEGEELENDQSTFLSLPSERSSSVDTEESD